MQQYPGQKVRKFHGLVHNKISMPPFFPGGASRKLKPANGSRSSRVQWNHGIHSATWPNPRSPRPRTHPP